MRFLRLLLALLLFRDPQPGTGCNRLYTTSSGGTELTRVNRRNGQTKVIGRWQTGGSDMLAIDSIEWSFPLQEMYGIETNQDKPGEEQRLVKVNRQKPRGANINNVTRGKTGRIDLRGLAIDGLDNVYTHSLDGTLFKMDIATGDLTPVFNTGLTNVLDLGLKIDTNELWAVTGDAIYTISLDGSEDVEEFEQVRTREMTLLMIHSFFLLPSSVLTFILLIRRLLSGFLMKGS